MAEPFDEMSDESVSNPHDRAFKSAFQVRRTARKFFERFLPDVFNRHIDYNHMAIVNKSYVDEKFREKHSDIVYTVRIKGRIGFLYILFEHQSSPDYWIVFRTLCYMVNLWKGFQDQNPDEKFLPVIIPLILYNGKTGWTAPKSFLELIPDGADFADVLPNFEYKLVNCRDYDNEALIEKCGDLTLGVVLFMMKNIFEDRFDPVLKSLMDLFMKMQDDPSFLRWLEWALTYAYYARNEDEQNLKKVIENNISHMKDERIMEVAMSVAERIEQRGMEKGIERGKKEGNYLLLLKQLKKRFRSVPESIEQKLSQSDLQTLDRIAEGIFDFKTINDVENCLN